MKSAVLQLAIFFLLLAGCKTKTDQGSLSPTEGKAHSLQSREETPKVVHLKAKPDTVVVDVARTAMIVVDMENDFCSIGGMMDIETEGQKFALTLYLTTV